MKYLSESGKEKTWDGYRWMFVLLAAVFGFITAWALSTGDFQGKAMLLLLIPGSFCVGLLLAAVFAKDRQLQDIIALFSAFI